MGELKKVSEEDGGRLIEELLRDIPENATFEKSRGMYSVGVIPIGSICHAAATEIAELKAEIARLEKMVKTISIRRTPFQSALLNINEEEL